MSKQYDRSVLQEVGGIIGGRHKQANEAPQCSMMADKESSPIVDSHVTLLFLCDDDRREGLVELPPI